MVRLFEVLPPSDYLPIMLSLSGDGLPQVNSIYIETP